MGAGTPPAGRALAVVTVELLRNSDANSMERKEGDLVGRWGGIYREPEGVPRKFFFFVLGLFKGG